MRLTADLQAAIENLYTVFATYPLQPSTNPCLHCHTEQQEERIRVRPLRELTGNDLMDYAFSALYTWGSESDFKHFLPRLFELLVITNDFDFVDPEVLFTKLPYASWWRWPEREQNAIRQFVWSLWHAAFSSTPEELGYFEIEDWICSLAQFEGNLLKSLRCRRPRQI